LETLETKHNQTDLLISSPMSFIRYVRNIRRTGIKQWWHQLQYIGDAKAGTLIGTDQ
jgi:hypothetical protein